MEIDNSAQPALIIFLPQYANQLLDFDEATSLDPTQTFEVPVSRDVVEFAVRCVGIFTPRNDALARQ